MKNKAKRCVLIAIISAISIYLLWLGYTILDFRTYGPLSAAAQSHPFFEAIGVFHIHSRYSDGRGKVDEIALAASHLKLDFIILTDHGSPNFSCLASEGWRRGVLVLAGSELSVSRGHLVGLGFRLPRRPFTQNAEQAAHQIREAGGFTIIAHPFSKTQWTWGKWADYSGLELMDADTMLKKNFWRSLPYLPSLFIRPRLFLLTMLDSPGQSFTKWDDLLEKEAVFGYFSADAHLLYRQIFQLFLIHVLLDRPLQAEFETAKVQVLDALRCGKFYNAIDAAADSRGFRFWMEELRGEAKVAKTMGETIFRHGEKIPLILRVAADFPYKKDIWLLRDGKKIHNTSESNLSREIDEPGAYRAEVYLREKSPLRQEIPWIVSNPIFVRKE